MQDAAAPLTRPETSAKWLIGSQIVFTLPFLALPVFEVRLRGWLAARNLDPLLFGYLHGSVARSAVFLCLASALYAAWAVWFHNRALDEKTRRGYTVPLVLLGAGMVYLVLTRCLQFPVSRDDAYIDYRHVMNLLTFHSLDYNPGQPVMGFTSHLHYLLLALLSLVTGIRDLSVLSQSVNIVTQAINYVFIFALMSAITRKPWAGLAAALAYVWLPYNLSQAIGGKESIIVQFLLLLSIWATYRGRLGTLSWAGALLFLTRPEGICYLLICALWTFWKRGFSAWKFWALPALAIAAWYVVLFLHFGTVLPHGGLAKKLIYYGYPSPASQIFSVIAMWLGLPANFVAAAAFLVLMLMILRRNIGLAIYCWGAALVFLFFVLSRPPLIFEWYVAWFSLLPAFAVGIVCEACGEIWRSRPWRLSAVLALSVAAVLLSNSAVSVYSDLKRAAAPLYVWWDGDQRLLLYRRAAEYINATGYRGTVAVSEPGAFGYAYKGVVLDLGGLVSAEMVRFLPIPKNERWSQFNTAIPNRAIHDLQPRYVVFFDAYARKSLLVNDWFLKNYTKRMEWPLKTWTVNGLLLYEKNAS